MIIAKDYEDRTKEATQCRGIYGIVERYYIRNQVNLTVTADLKYFVEDLEVPFEQIEPMIARELEKKRDQETIVLLHADKSLNLQDVVNLFDIGNKLKTKMILFTQKDK